MKRVTAAWLILSLSLFSGAPQFLFAEEDGSSSGTAITTGDASAEAEAGNVVNTNYTTSGNADGEETTTVTNENEGTVSNSGTIEATTGSNSAVGSTTAAVDTGDAAAGVNVVNVVNLNIIDSQGLIMLLNSFGGALGDIDFRALGLTPLCTAESCGLYSNGELNALNTNSATIENDFIVGADSGGNSASGTNASISTGNAYAGANVVNLANTNIMNSNYLILAFNGFSGWLGNLIFPSKYYFESPAVSGSGVANTTLATINSADIQNTAGATVDTGGNQASGSGASVTTGNAEASVNVLNQANSNFIGSDALVVVIRVFGTWNGSVFGAPSNVSWTETSGGITLFSNGASGSTSGASGGSMNASSTNTALIRNSMQVFSLTGANRVEASENASIETGNARAAVNLLNVANTNVVGRNWVLALINIFGDWNGNISFGQPDLFVAEKVEHAGISVDPGGAMRHSITVSNNGDADATNVRLKTMFTPGALNALPPDAAVTDSSIVWNLGTLHPGESRFINYTATLRERIGSMLIHETSASSDEPDANSSNNQERVAIEITKPAPPPNSANIAWPDLKLTASNSATTSVYAGQTVDFKFIVKNEGMGPAFNVRVKDAFGFIGSSTPIETHTWPVGDMAGGEEVTLSYTLRISSKAPFGEYRSGANVIAKDARGYDLFFLMATSGITVVPKPAPPITPLAKKAEDTRIWPPYSMPTDAVKEFIKMFVPNFGKGKGNVKKTSFAPRRLPVSVKTLEYRSPLVSAITN